LPRKRRKKKKKKDITLVLFSKQERWSLGFWGAIGDRVEQKGIMGDVGLGFEGIQKTYLHIVYSRRQREPEIPRVIKDAQRELAKSGSSLQWGGIGG
jgi:hypothetical protein